jgi:TatD DNase family protein
VKIFDAHNHLQATELAPWRDAFLASGAVAGMVVNGTSEADWAAVAELAAAHAGIRASYGVHPWRVDEVSAEWRERLSARLDGGGVVGEIGLDRWKTDRNFDRQLEIFRWQLGEAARRGLPVTIHCLRAWGALNEVLHEATAPPFLLHAYGGPVEMVRGFVERGGYFSFSGSFLAANRERKREAFLAVPLDRLLVETDAPDMPLPEELDQFAARSATGERVNHPGNLGAVYAGLAELRGMPVAELAGPVAGNYARLFGS